MRFARSGRLVVCALVLAAALLSAYVASVAWDTDRYSTLDDLWTIVGARIVENDPSTLLGSSHFSRGPERLTSLVIAIVSLPFANTWQEFRAAHVVLPLLWFLSVLPLYGLARFAGVPRWGAALAALLGVVGPWMVFGLSLYSILLALPTAMLLAWATVRTAREPSVPGDLLVVAAAVLTVVARTGNLPFVVIPIAAVLYGTLLRRPPGESVLRVPVRAAREHPVLAAGVLAGVVVLLVLGPSRLVGSYAGYGSDDLELPWYALYDHLAFSTAELALACGAIPLVVGGAWALRAIVRPPSTDAALVAFVLVAFFVVFVYLFGSTKAANEERYVAVIAGLPAIGFAAALFRREAWPLGTLIAGVLVARAIAWQGQFGDSSPFAHLVAPARIFYTQVVLNRLDVALPGDRDAMPTVAMVLMIAASVVVAALFAGGRRWRLSAPPAVAYGLLAVLAVAGVLEGRYTLRKFQPAVSLGRGPEASAFVDRATGGATTLTWVWGDPATIVGRNYTMMLAEYANRSAGDRVEGDLVPYFAPDGTFTERVPPKYLLRFRDFSPVGFESEVVAEGLDPPPYRLVVERLIDQRAAFVIDGPGPDGFLPDKQRATFRLLPAAKKPGRCVAIDVGVPPDRPATSYTATGVASGRLRPGEARTLRPSTEGEKTLTITARGEGLRLGESRLVRC